MPQWMVTEAKTWSVLPGSVLSCCQVSSGAPYISTGLVVAVLPKVRGWEVEIFPCPPGLTPESQSYREQALLALACGVIYCYHHQPHFTDEKRHREGKT